MAYTPEEANAAVAGLVANPIPARARQTIISGGAFNSWDIRFIPGQPGMRYGDVRIDDQEAEPTNPGIRQVTSSAYGQTIPVSLGRRRLPGNVIQSTQMVPRLVGGRDYEITYKIPVYLDPPDDKPMSVDVNPEPDRPRPDPENPPGKCNDGNCDDNGTGPSDNQPPDGPGGGDGGNSGLPWTFNISGIDPGPGFEHTYVCNPGAFCVDIAPDGEDDTVVRYATYDEMVSAAGSCDPLPACYYYREIV